MKTLRKFGSWIGNQLDGFARGVMSLARTPPKSWLPAGIWSTLVWLWSSITWSFGTSTPIKMITSSFALGLFALLTSWITLGATLALVAFWSITFGIGLLRLFPAFDRAFVSARDTVIP